MQGWLTREEEEGDVRMERWRGGRRQHRREARAVAAAVPRWRVAMLVGLRWRLGFVGGGEVGKYIWFVGRVEIIWM